LIDSHHHLWRIGHNDCRWPTAELTAIHRDFELAEFRSVASPLGVTGSIVVQSQPSDLDTDYLLDLAEAAPFILGVVGWVDLAGATAVKQIDALAARRKLRGLRAMLQDLARNDWITDAALDPAIDAMVRRGLTLDALVFTRHLDGLNQFVRRHPDLSVVIDHGAKPPVAAGALEPWRARMSALAELPHLSVKLSGLLTEAAPGQDARAITPYVDHLIDVFGPERMIWGSDWPVLNLAGDYGGWLSMARGLTAALGESAQKAIFETNARRIYGL